MTVTGTMQLIVNLLLLLIYILSSCENSSSKGKIKQEVRFVTRQIPVSSDTTINSIAFYKGYYLCGQDNGKILIFDTNYVRQYLLEKRINKKEDSFVFNYHDSIFISGKNHVYLLEDSFNLKEFSRKERIYGDPLFEDSSYYIYGCCAGEFGGSIFFLDKKMNKTYSYFATCPSQVLRFQNTYVVCNNLAHLSGMMSFLFVKDPSKLYELTVDSLKYFCNWWITVDSLKDYWGRSKVGDVKYYQGPYSTLSLITFQFGDSLYSIVSSNKATLLTVHRKDSVYAVDTIVKRNIPFHQAQVIQAGKKQVCLYNLTSGSPFEAYRITGHNSGLIVVDQNRIDLLYRKQQ